MTSDEGSEFQRLVYLDLASHKTTALTPDLKWDVDELDLSQDGRWMAFDADEDGISALHVLDTKTGKEVPVPKLPVGVISGVNGVTTAASWRSASVQRASPMMSIRSTWLRARSSAGPSAKQAG